MESIARSPDAERLCKERGLVPHAGSSGDLVDAVDANDQVIGTVQRGDIFRLGVNCRVAHVLVFNSAREILLQRIAAGLRHEGMWGSSAAGFVRAGETYAAAALRKLSSELGITATLDAVGKTSMLDGTSMKFIGVYQAMHEGPFVADPTSGSELQFSSIASVMAHLQTGAREFTPTFLTVLDFYQRQVSAP